ncbi:MAG: hypothetical protein IPL70_03770 [Uliginosibacterium sp.]|nr:hypothetical protein [Uliginosibacterium sp.]
MAMRKFSDPDGVPTLTPAVLDEIEACLDAGLFLQTHPHIDPLIAQGGPRGALLAARALSHRGPIAKAMRSS